VLLNKRPDITLSHSPLDVVLRNGRNSTNHDLKKMNIQRK